MLEPTSPLIATIVIALVAAAAGGLLATRLRLPPIVGYLMAGVAIGTFTPGLFADQHIANELAELGVILLMFGVGIHFSFKDLYAVRGIAVPGAVVQIAVAVALATFGGAALGLDRASGVVLGLVIAVASTVVLLRALLDRDILETIHGRVAIGWLIVEDLFIVLVLVLLPVYASIATGGPDAAQPMAILVAVAVVFAKVGVLTALMIIGGTRLVPRFLLIVARTGSREMFTLGVLAIALGVAFGSYLLFDVSLALGAFLAGAALSGSDLGKHAEVQALPLRDAFTVLFFVSVGMLLDPAVLLLAPLAVAGLVFMVTIGKGLAAFALVAAFGYPVRTALTVSIGLAQIGEFSFIVSAMALSLGLLPANVHSLVVATAIITITMNPFLFNLIEPLERRLAPLPLFNWLARRGSGQLGEADSQVASMRQHAILCGHGQVGGLIARALAHRGFSHVVIDLDRRTVERLRESGVEALYGDAGDPHLLDHAGIAEARMLIVAMPDPFATRRVVEYAQRVRPDIEIVARTHSETEWRHLRSGKIGLAVLGERELAIAIATHALRRFGVSAMETLAITRGLRERE